MKQRFRNWSTQLEADTILELLIASIILMGILSLLIGILSENIQTLMEFAAWWTAWLQLVSAGLVSVTVFFLLLRWFLPLARQVATAEEPAESTITVSPQIQQRRRALQVSAFVSRLSEATTKEARQPILDEMRNLDLLREANLSNLNLEGANLFEADLRGALLERTNLQGAYIVEANLQSANLNEANLQKAELSWSDLKGAFIGGADLRGTWLLRTNLEGVYIKTARLDRNTRLPDGTRWNVDTNLQRFNDPENPYFWRPEPGFFGELPRWFRRNGSVSAGEMAAADTASSDSSTSASAKPAIRHSTGTFPAAKTTTGSVTPVKTKSATTTSSTTPVKSSTPPSSPSSPSSPAKGQSRQSPPTKKSP